LYLNFGVFLEDPPAEDNGDDILESFEILEFNVVFANFASKGLSLVKIQFIK
jgi:hypothetical protein